MTIKLNQHQQQIIEVLKQNNGWVAQDELAHDLGKEKLSPDDVMQLDLLGEAGLLVKEISDNLGSEGENVRYRFTEPKANPHTNVGRHHENV